LDPVYTPDRTRKWMRVSNQANVRSISSSMLLHRWLRVTASCNRHHTRSIGFVSGAYVGREWTPTRPAHSARHFLTALHFPGLWAGLWWWAWPRMRGRPG